MLKPLISVLSVAGVLIVNHADACQCSYKKDASGKKIFSSDWNSKSNTGSISFEIGSSFPSSATPAGEYDLTKAKAHGIPELQSPVECKVSFEGTMVYDAEKAYSKGPLKLSFSGKDCKQYVSEAAYKNVVNLPIWKIDMGGSEASLTIRVTQSALNDCGSTGNLSQRGSDCLAKNPKTSKQGVLKNNKSYPWALISYDEKLGPVWKDETSKTVWSAPPKPGVAGATRAEALDTCKADDLLKQVPSTGDFEKAFSHGLFKVYPVQFNMGFVASDEPIGQMANIFAVTDRGKMGVSGVGPLEKKYFYFCIGH